METSTICIYYFDGEEFNKAKIFEVKYVIVLRYDLFHTQKTYEINFIDKTSHRAKQIK